MHNNMIILFIGISTFSSFTNQVIAKEIFYNKNQKIILSDSIQPGDDFYNYVNNNWINNAKIPNGMPRINSFIDLYLILEKQLQHIINELQIINESKLDHNQRNIRNLYLSYINKDIIEKIGILPIKNDLKTIKQAKNHNEISNLMTSPYYSSIINYWVDLDAKNPKEYILYISQGNLELPNRNYYLENSDQMKKIRKDYYNYITIILKKLGENNVNNRAKKILELEKSIAKIHWTPEEQRDTIKNYNAMSLQEMKNFTNGFNWDFFIKKNKLNEEKLKKIIVETDSSVQNTIKIFLNTQISTIKDYLILKHINRYAGFLNKEFFDIHFNFFSKKLYGIKKQRTRKQKALQIINSLQGEALGKIYVKKYFNQNSKEKIQELVNNIRKTFSERLKNNNWMDSFTQQEALKKLDNFSIKIGYPDKWNDFSDINLNSKTLINNYKQILKWNNKNTLSKLGQPNRKWEWEMTPQTVNAYFNPVQNEIVFPAAILQAPFFDCNVDPAYNYGSIGAVIAHEMGHAFDDQGSLYDSTGQLRNWWSDTAKNNFKEKTKKLINQYNTFEVNGKKINGNLTLGENIGDLGGLNIALNSYKHYTKKNYLKKSQKNNYKIGLQYFFISWARIWRELSNKESELNRIITDPHSPYKFRTNGVIRNIEEWYIAFDVNENNKLYLKPEERVFIW
ncbi:M13 family metallopeptidase [Candidatus Providencia siddallii]|uniref:Zinc metalloprotease Zmp1-related protein n=1 Tax=Candidatus Providencia siddallii TaxID=1715285 RepID=A0ABM9NNQ2_9GAMM